MITPKTTFVVGAGGSEPYGLPIAKELSQTARKLEATNPAYQLALCALDGQYGLLNSVLADFQEHPATSLDAFLEHRQHLPETMKVGKVLLAVLIGNAIAARRERKRSTPPDHDWIRHIIDEMSKGVSRAANFAGAAQNLSFITFNFDSVIEERAARLIRSIYNGDDGLNEAMTSIRVTHVHGHVSDPPAEVMHVEPPGYVGYTHSGISGQWIQWTKNAAAEIRVVLEDIADDLLRTVQQTISQSAVVCFLGFSYDKGNLVKLGFPKKDSTTPHKIRHAFGSAFGLTPADRHRAEDRIGTGLRIELGDPSAKCIDLLRSHYVLRD